MPISNATELRVEQRPITALIPYVSNARTHSDAQVAQIAASIREFGWTNPILVDGRNGVIAGHGRLLAARKLGMEQVPVIELAHLSEPQKRAYVIADNRLALNAGWDEELLTLELGELMAVNFDLSLTGFAPGELEERLGGQGKTGLTDDDAAPAAPEEPVSKLGDLWLLGEHRLLCGDSTDRASVDRLMGGEQADIVFTDPPYGMAYGGGRAAGSTPRGARVKAHGMIKNDDLAGEDLTDLIRDALSNAVAVKKLGAACYICCTWRTYEAFQRALNECNLGASACIVWDKKWVGLGRQHYRPQHEFILYTAGESWYGGKGQSDVWTLAREPGTEYVHPTQKPVELVTRALLHSSKQDDIVLDCFGGSGSTLVAAEKHRRKARLIELDPKYVDVIVQRWQQWSGSYAVLDGSNAPFQVVGADRIGAPARSDAA
jgi:DNA modification methylase